MRSHMDSDANAMFDAFLKRYFEDLEAGRQCSLSEYLRLFPGDESRIAREFLAVRDSPSTVRLKGPESAMSGTGATRIGPYVIERELGRGGQSVVYLARDERLGRCVALKVLRSLGPGSEEVLQRFRREVAVTTRLAHPGICPVHDAGLDEGNAWIAMRYIEGEPLQHWLQASRADNAGTTAEEASRESFVQDLITPPSTTTLLPARSVPGRTRLPRILAVFEEAARALHAAHESGVVHRDVKPGNILVTRDDHAVILDFGLAGDELADATLTRTGDLFGTPAYMSPEQLSRGSVRTDRRTDVWSLGVALYESVAGARPFVEPTRERLFQSILDAEPLDPRRANPAITRDLRTVILCCIEKDRNLRYQTCDALGDDLRRVVEGRPVAARPVGVPGRLLRWGRREPALATLVLLLLLGLPSASILLTSWLKDRPLADAQKAIALQRHKDALVSEGALELADGSPGRALPLFEAANREPGGSPEGVAGIVLSLLELGRPGEALEALDVGGSVLAGRRSGLLLRFHLLEALGRSGEAALIQSDLPPFEDAIDYYVAAAGDLWRADAGGGSEAGSSALRHLSRAIDLAESPRALYHQAAVDAAVSAVDTDAAARHAEVLEFHWKDSPIAWHWAGYGWMHADPARAIAAYRRSLSLRPASATWNNLGLALQGHGDMVKAIEAYRSAIAIRREDATAWFNLGNALREQGRADDAVAAYREAVSHRPAYAKAWANLGVVLTKLERHQDAIAAHQRAAELTPRDPMARFNLATAHRASGSLDAAILAYREAVAVAPGHQPSWFNLGGCLQAKNDLEGAVHAFREAADLDRTDSKAWVNLGAALGACGHTREAINAFQRATDAAPGEAIPWQTLGQALFVARRLLEALHVSAKAIALDPDDAVALTFSGLALRDLGFLKDALPLLRHGHRIGSARAGWPHPTDRWIERLERDLAEQEKAMDGFESPPASGSPPEQLPSILTAALATGRVRAGARWFRELFIADPSLLSRPGQPQLLHGTRSALAEGFGLGDAGDLPEEERSRSRNLARHWIERSLLSWTAAGDEPDNRALRLLEALQRDPLLGGVRDEALDLLPAREQPRWRWVWEELSRLLEEAR